MYESLTFTTRTDDMEADVKWACFEWDGIYHEIRPILDSEGNVDNLQTLQECKDFLESQTNDTEVYT